MINQQESQVSANWNLVILCLPEKRILAMYVVIYYFSYKKRRKKTAKAIY
jgi:hypothetical protein